MFYFIISRKWALGSELILMDSGHPTQSRMGFILLKEGLRSILNDFIVISFIGLPVIFNRYNKLDVQIIKLNYERA